MRQETSRVHSIGSWIGAALIATALLIGVLHQPAHAAPPALKNPAQDTLPHRFDCAAVSDISTAECEALLALHRATNGNDWRERTGWLMNGTSPCGWYGVSCEEGRVRKLLLGGNNLRGNVPSAICVLADGTTELDLGYNALATRKIRARRCLEQLQPNWAATQTVAPVDVQVTAIFTSAIQLAWTPIAYANDGGFYEIAVATEPDGPYVTHGQTPSKTSAGYRVDGLAAGRTHYLRLRSHTPAHAKQPLDLSSDGVLNVAATAHASERVLLMAYFPADNDLATYVPALIRRLNEGTALNPNITVALLVDGSGAGDTRLLEIRSGAASKTSAVFDEWGVNELDTADPAVMAWFLRYARESYPAQRELVALMGHGIALAPEIEWPAVGAASASPHSLPAGDIPPLPRGMYATPADITNRGYLSATDLGRALLAATDNGANPFDLVFFDQCFQGNLDTLYEVRKAAEVFVASPNYGWFVAAYHQYLPLFAPAASPGEMAQAIIDRYQRNLDDNHPNSIFWLRSDDIAAVAERVSRLGDALLAATRAGETQAIGRAVQNGQFVDTNQCGRQQFELGPPDELIGLDTFAANLQTGFAENSPGGDPHGVHDAAGEVLAALEPIRVRARTGTPYLAPRRLWDFTDTLTVLAPLPRTSPARAIWRTTLYREDTPFSATWSIDPAQGVTVTESLAFVRDGRWDEFLQEWYTTPLTPTVGAWCHYIPPQRFVLDDADPLTLTVSQAETDNVAQLVLGWTPTDDVEATDYRIYLRGPFDIGPALQATVSLDETSFTLAVPDAGEYELAVLAPDAEETFVAASNVVTYTVELIEPERRILLPLVSRP